MTADDQSPAQTKKTGAILNAAKRHFAKHGFEGTKLSAVAKDAGVAVGTIYLRYEGKAQLLRAVFDGIEQSFADAMNEDALWGVPFPDRFTGIIGAVFLVASKEPDLGQLMALSSFASSPSDQEKSAIISTIEQHLRDGVERSELRADIDLPMAASMAHGMVEGAMREVMATPSKGPDAVAQIVNAAKLWLTAPR